MPRSDDGETPLVRAIDRLVHEPARLVVLVHLSVVESADATFLLNRTRLTWGNLASHLSKLEDAGYVAVEKRFVDRKPKTLLSLTEQGRAALHAYRELIAGLLDAIPR